ncbi:protein containing DUF1566 [Candidatus Magnetobacterium bavaricum]|uniref:Protein containing DUF1566 n=1 Tax=Candidatus Magnetobacterium bavaricum TaxID=29290 RepID=A0A0F3GRI8_9BACT|nr:protein containing DUF1566 [Candidatus Magnetobacterium bavaricum]
MTFGSYAAKSVEFISANKIVVSVPFAVIDDKVSGLPQGSYSVSVDGKEAGSFLALALPNNPYPSGSVLKNTVSAMANDFVARKASIQSSIETMRTNTTDATTLEFLDGLSSLMPALETFLRNDASGMIDQIDTTMLATIEQTILANNRGVNFHMASPNEPHGYLMSRSTVMSPRKLGTCSELGGDRWMEERARYVELISMFEVMETVLSACSYLPIASCYCNSMKLGENFAAVLVRIEFEQLGNLDGITIKAGTGQEGAPTDKLSELRLKEVESSKLEVSIKNTKESLSSSGLDTIINAAATAASCSHLTVVSPLIQLVQDMAKLAKRVNVTTFEATCPISFEKLDEPKRGENGWELDLTGNGFISWSWFCYASPASLYFKPKSEYLTLKESLGFGSYEVKVKNKPVLYASGYSGGEVRIGEKLLIPGCGYTPGGSVELRITDPRSDGKTHVVTTTASSVGSLSPGELNYNFIPVKGTHRATKHEVQVTDLGSGKKAEEEFNLTILGDRFRDNGDGSMWDMKTNLVWMQKSNGCNGVVTWEKANTCVPSGWRLPTIQELYSLCRTDGTTTGLDVMLNYDWSAPDPNPEPSWYCNGTPVDVRELLYYEGFDVRSYHYWSSTTGASHTSDAWGVDMGVGSVHSGGKTDHDYVWPVRSGH